MKNFIGYFLGGLVFVCLLPVGMWYVSQMPDIFDVTLPRAVVAIVLAVLGIALSVWSIVYMKRNGEGNPLDAFGHEVGQRTRHLMTEGPYRLSRNPMLSGSLVYYAGVCVWLWTWQSVVVLAGFVLIMWAQLKTEEKRLREDFGDEYDAYCRRTGMFLPFSFRK